MLIAGNLWDFMWSLVVIFFMITYFMILFHVIVDIFRRRDASGMTKAFWLLFVFFLPLLGMLSYMITQGDSMGQRAVADAQQAQQQTDDYIRSVTGGSAGEIEKAKGLLDSGAINQQEFEAIKAKALAS